MPVVVNRRLITEAEINEESARVESGGITQRQVEAARRLAIRELLSQRALELGIDCTGDLDAAIDQMLEREVRIPEVDETACRRYFEANPERFRTPVTAMVRHILIKSAPDDPEQRTEAENRAGEVLAQLCDDPDLFTDMAARHSACPSATNGGHLGAISRGQTVPEFEAVVLRLAPGLAKRPVETRYGFHVVEILSREGGHPLAYEDVSSEIAEYLHEKSWRRAVHQYIQLLINEAEIRGVDFPENATPLIQ
jgi:peptidyl-prolyl cis-trans isomerase C